MGDMSIDERRLMRATGRVLERPEVKEIENAYLRVAGAQLEDMYRQLREMYDVDETVTDEHLRFSAQYGRLVPARAVAPHCPGQRRSLAGAGGFCWGNEVPHRARLESVSASWISGIAFTR
jgi:hypothetical protein